MLRRLRAGDAAAAESLLDVAYADLGGLARAQLASERRGHTLQSTALVHEAWLKVANYIDRVEDRTHFFAVAAQAMRRILTDHARRSRREKRGGKRVRVVLDPSSALDDESGFDLVDLEDSLSQLAALNERHARVVELRVFGGLTISETAEVLEVSHTTVESDWFTARAWLRRELGRAG